MNIILLTRQYRLYILHTIAVTLLHSCSSKMPQIIHMDFLDSQTILYRDSTRVDSIKFTTFYYFVDESHKRNINNSSIEKFIATDSLLQKTIAKKPQVFTVLFYKKSEMTKRLKDSKSGNLLTYCNDDILLERIWKTGALDTTFYYDNGEIIGSENIVAQ